ncbi:PREDICTED: dual serine/threonine and tyrosine protein kinase [Ficedula albicollis]|uniref:dual serine/threonine and tyrosine protein kinase n=1 Tax=Ficedula albicollis TaxID=59894 RepID=UPI000359B583|nr:PREDICTED: dual serine/threonine and tyrosine protein kinase [Ficedula albicollis]
MSSYGGSLFLEYFFSSPTGLRRGRGARSAAALRETTISMRLCGTTDYNSRRPPAGRDNELHFNVNKLHLPALLAREVRPASSPFALRRADNRSAHTQRGRWRRFPSGEGGPSPAWFPRQEEEQLQRSVSWRPCLLILGQNCGAKGRLLNALLGQQLLPAPGAGDKELPAPGAGTEELLPRLGDGTEELLTPEAGTEELPSRRAGTEELLPSPTSCTEELPSRRAGTEELLPSPTSCTEELPSRRAGTEELLPSPTSCTEELPSRRAGTEELLPSPTSCTEELPSRRAGTEELLPSPTSCTEELPSRRAGTEELLPSRRAGTEELPSRRAGTEELLPSPRAGTEELLTPRAGTEELPSRRAGTEELLPSPTSSGEERCRRRRVRFTHGARTRLSLALPGQYELVQALAAHRGHWDTIPEQDLQVPGDAEDPAQRAAELEVVLPYALLKEVDIVVAPCRGFQSAEATLGEFVNQVLPVVTFAISEPQLSPSDQAELRDIKEKFSLPIFFLRVSEPCGEPDRDRSPLQRQLLDLELLSPSGPCGVPAPSMPERLRLLSAFCRQVLQQHLVQAATRLSEVHGRCLNIFINQAFDMQRDLQITPKRLEYTRRKESELYESLMGIANRKQEEMKDMIVETLGSMKEELLEDAASMDFRDIIIPENGEPVSSKDIKRCIQQIQELIISRLNQAVANKLISSVDYLRESFVGTLERCLKSLEESWEGSVHPARGLEKPREGAVHITSNYLKQILNAAYHVEVTFHSGSTVTRMLWEQIKQIIQRLTWVSPPAISSDWKRKVAQDAIESLSASKLAKSICSQFRTRLNSSHEAFAASLRQLEDGHWGRLERTEDLWLKVRKEHAPRLARLALESRSLQDVLLHGKPRLGRELGRGQYGVVYLCDSWGGHFPCALKSVVPPDEKHWNDLALEFHYMRSLQSHERLVHLHGSVIDYGYGGGSSIAVLLIMERLHRDLYTGLKAGLELEPRLQIALDVVEGIRYLHSQGLVHRDIKLKNVLLDKKNRAKITDLGFCKPEAMMSGSIVGTPIHMAPELFTGKYDNSVDVYAFGILFWYLCSGHVKLPEAFERCASKDHLWNNVRRGVRPERLPVFDEECWQLMEACWAGDSSQRPLLGIVQPMLQGIMDRLCRAASEHPHKGLDDST